MLKASFESWPRNEQTAKVLGWPLAAVTTPPLLASGDGGQWFEPKERMVVWHRFTRQHGVPAASLEAALARVRSLPSCRDQLMKYITIAVLLAIFVGAVFYTVNHRGEPLEAGKNTGWMQR
ncbi:MAG: hypothetical protein H6974_11675 [Gammaproteobacteria bacterium]|nr:hypothetical protein [Gammaproteobacteria bacterium]